MEIKDISVTRLMSTDLVTVSPDTPLSAAGETMLEEGVGSVIVVEDDQPVGILTSTDFVDLVTNGEVTTDTTVSTFMSEDMVTLSSADSMRDAAVTMMSDDIQHLPVEDDDGAIAGMLSTTDLTAHLSYLEG